jgi:drug/metabolite transporter (DMT)-like permease
MIWGFSLVAAYDLLGAGIPPFFLIAVTYGIGALTLFATKAAVGSTPKISKNELKYGLLAGLLIFAAFGLQTVGLQYTTPARSGLLTVLYVLFVPIIISLMRKKLSMRSIVFASIGFIGVFFMSGVENASMNAGDIATIACAVMFAMHFVVLERSPPSLNTINFTLIQMTVAASAAIAISMMAENSRFSGMDPMGSFVGLLFMGLIVTALGFFVQTAAQKRIPAASISVMCCTESVFSMAFSWALGHDDLTFPLLAGAGLIVSSAVLSSLFEKKNHIGRELSNEK